MLVMITLLSLIIGLKILSMALAAAHTHVVPRLLRFLEDVFVPVDGKHHDDASGDDVNTKDPGQDTLGAHKAAWQAPGGHDPKASMYF
jgi:hypothetical protein